MLELYDNHMDNELIYINVRGMNRYTTQYMTKHETTMKPR